MKNLFKKGIIILGVYVIFTLYLFAVSERIERLDNGNKIENTGVAINIGE